MDDAFLVASKSLWALLEPETMLVGLLAAGFVALLLHRRILALVLLGFDLGCFLLAGFYPLAGLLMWPLEHDYPAHPPLKDVAGIVVLGGAEDVALSSYWGLPQTNDAGDRYLAAIALARRFPEARVLFSGGYASASRTGPNAADLADEIFTSAGIEKSRILLERESRNTAENADFSLRLVDKGRAGSWVLVTSAFHMRRAMSSFCAAGWHDLVPWPTDFRYSDLPNSLDWNLGDNLGNLLVAEKEWIGLLAYRLTGRAVALSPQGTCN